MNTIVIARHLALFYQNSTLKPVLQVCYDTGHLRVMVLLTSTHYL
jgi:hypothetical protein